MPRLPIALFLIAVFTSACSGGSHTAASSTPTQSPPSPASTQSAAPSSRPAQAPPASLPPPPAPTPSLISIPFTAPSATPAVQPSVNLPSVAVPHTAKPERTSPPLRAVPTPKPISDANLPPRIEQVLLSESTVHSGDSVIGRVRASPNTASVEARLGGYSINLTKTGVGTFVVTYHVPWLPFFLHGRYQVLLIARNTAGRQTRETIPIQFQ